MPRARIIGKGLIDKRTRIVRSLAAHVRFLELMATLSHWTPPPHVERPRRGDEAFPYRQLTADRYYTPRAKPELAHPLPGAEALSDAAIAAWVAENPDRRAALPPKMQRALAYLATFAPKVAAC